MKRRVLFFIAEGVPTDEERAAAERLGLDKRCFRNAQAVSNGFIEKCDAVAGCVPAAYAHYPTPVQAAAKWAEEERAAMAAVTAETEAIAEREKQRADLVARREAEARVQAEMDRQRHEAEARGRLAAKSNEGEAAPASDTPQEESTPKPRGRRKQQ